MKNASLFASLLFLSSLAACGDKEEDTAAETSETTESTEQTSEVEEVL